MTLKHFAFLALISFGTLFAKGGPAKSHGYGGPYFTGPLLTPSPHIVPYPHVDYEPYFFAVVNNGQYSSSGEFTSTENSYTYELFGFLQWGVTSNIDIRLGPQILINNKGSNTNVSFGDLGFGVDYQLIKERPDSWVPALKIATDVLIPISKYQKLNPDENGTDSFGGGAFRFLGGFGIGKMLKFGEKMYMNTRIFTSYSYFTPTHVKGFHAYGGGHGTSGWIYPGNTYNFTSGAEFTWTEHWALSMDLTYKYSNKTRFSGEQGIDGEGNIANNTSPWNDRWTLAPAIEYNWNDHLGLIVGSWFSFAGRNTGAFYSGVAAFNMYW